MGFDIIVTVFILFMGVLGYRNGFTYTFIRLLGWVLSIVLAFIFYPSVSNFLKVSTGFYDSLHNEIMEKLNQTDMTSDVWYHSLPDFVQKFLTETTSDLANSFATSLTNLLLTLISFLIIVFAVKMVAFTLTFLFSKRNRRGIIGLLDGVLGLASGLAIGVAISLLILTLVMPYATITGNTFILDALNNSILSKEFFDQVFQRLIALEFNGS